MKVVELMTKQAVTCNADEACSAAAKQMWDCDCGSVPVLGGDGRLVGMITDRDICMAAWMRDRAPSAIAVSSVMSTDLCVCRASDSVESAEQLMRSKQFRRLPVVDDERRVVGILSLADIVRAAGKQRASGRREIPADEVTATLVDIRQPRQVGATGPGLGA